MNKSDLERRLRTVFQSELEQQVRVMNADLLALEQDPADSERFLSLFRVAHSLKGAAAASDLPLIADVCHKLESMLSHARHGAATLGKRHFALLFAAADALAEASDILRGGGDVSASRLAAVNAELELWLADGEGISPGTGLLQVPRAAELDTAPSNRSADQSSSRQHGGAFLRLETGKLDSMQAAVEQVAVAVGDVLKRLSESRETKDASAVAAEARALSSALRELEEIIRIVQMRPFEEACEMLARVVRDVSAELGKEVSLEITGGDVEADREVIDALREALLQLVRNAVDHGVEAPAARRAAGKPERARMRISAELHGEKLRVTVSDDGHGLDMADLRKRLIGLGRRVADDDAAIIDALFRGGVSTRDEATAISGRGVGMNLVWAAVKRIHGEISVESAPGLGTTFTIELPLTLATVRSLIVTVGQQLFALPIANVTRVRRAGPEDIKRAEGSALLISAEKMGADPIPVVSLARVLGPPFAERPWESRVPAILLESAGGRLALMVDDVVAERQITIRRIDSRGADLSSFMGAAVLPGGQVALVLNVPALVTAGMTATGGGVTFREADSAEGRRRRVLVVDDSITTRTLEQSVLEAGGYDTITAVDGAAAWEVLGSETVDLVVADVEMPRMDGFALCEAIRGSRKLSALPVVLVTALEKPEHRARGLEAGADAYIVKSSFDQQTLLDTVERLVG